MTQTYTISDEAQNDIEAIFQFIARDNAHAAYQFTQTFYDKFEMLAHMPLMGHKREDLTKKPIRFWPIGDYLILYDPAAKPLRIIRILHGHRDVGGMV